DAMPGAQVLRNTAQQIRAALEHAARAPEQADALLARLHESLQDEDQRLGHLQDALLGAGELEALAARLREHGYATTHAALEQRPGGKTGWSLGAVRGGAGAGPPVAPAGRPGARDRGLPHRTPGFPGGRGRLA